MSQKRLKAPTIDCSSHLYSLPPIALSSGHQINTTGSTNVCKALLDLLMGFPGSSAGKESACNAKDPGSVPGLGICPGEGNGNLLQYSYLENPMNRGSRWATAHGVAKSWTQLSHQHKKFCTNLVEYY